MKTITLWSVAMSTFFSLSVTGSLYEAAAGSSVGVDRALGDFAVRMGLDAVPPSEVPVAGRIQIADRAPSKDLSPIVNWVQREGRSITDSGRPVAVNRNLARDLGLEAVDWPAKQKAFGPTDRPDITCLFQVAELNGRREFIVIRSEDSADSARLFWRVGLDGRVISTARSVPGSAPGPVPNERYADLLRRMLDGLLETMPGGSRVN